MRHSPDPTVELVAADPRRPRAISMARRGLDIWVVGGGTLAHALLAEIDQFILKQHSSVIGSGIPMLNGPISPMFHPTDMRLLDSGVRVVTSGRA